MQAMKLITYLFSALFFINTACYAEQLTLSQVEQSICRVSAQQGREYGYGTGTCIGENSQYYYILTNYHVVGNSNKVSVEFFNGQNKSEVLPTTVIYRRYVDDAAADLAILALSKKYTSSFQPGLPRVIQLAPRGSQLVQNQLIAGVGCPQGGWAKSWSGKITSLNGSTVSFVPAPVGGQSGTGIIAYFKDRTGGIHTRVSVLLTWTNGVNGFGQSLDTIYKVLSKEVNITSEDLIPLTFQQVAEQSVICDSCGKPFSEHVLCTDGQYRCPLTTKMFLLPGVRPLDDRYLYQGDLTLSQYLYQDCPNGVCPNPRRQQPDYNNGSEVPPEVFGSPFEYVQPQPESPIVPQIPQTPVPQPQDDTKLKELEALLSKVMLEKEGLAKQLDSLNLQYEELRKNNEETLNSFSSLKDLNTGLSTELLNKNKELSILVNNYNEAKGKEQELNKMVDDINAQYLVTQNNLNITKNEVQEVSWWRNILATTTGGAGVLGIFLLGYNLLRKVKGKSAVTADDLLKAVEDRAKGGLSSVEDKIEQALKNKFGNLVGGGMSELLESLLHKKLSPLIDKLDTLRNNNSVGQPMPVSDKDRIQQLEGTVNDLYTQLVDCANKQTNDLVGTAPTESNTVTDFNNPPPVIYPKKPMPVGYGALPPEMPAHKYSGQEIMTAIDEIARQYTNSPVLQHLPELLKQKLDKPRRG